jgi:hypothetical protein
MPDFKTIADFRKDNGEAIRKVCREFVVLCRRLELFSEASVAIDGSKFKAVNTRDRNFTEAKMQRRLTQIDESIARYLAQLDSADRQGEAVPEAKVTRLNEKIATLRQEIRRLNALNAEMMQTEDKQISLTDPDERSMATCGPNSDPENRRSAVPDDQVGPPHPDQTNKRTDPDHSPADPSCAAPADDPRNQRNHGSRVVSARVLQQNRFNSGHRKSRANSPNLR